MITALAAAVSVWMQQLKLETPGLNRALPMIQERINFRALLRPVIVETESE